MDEIPDPPNFNPGNPKRAFLTSDALPGVITAAMLLGLPLAGIGAAGKAVDAYLQFPPLTQFVTHAGFSWKIFALFAAIDLILVFFIAGMLKGAHGRSRPFPAVTRHRFPAWGWLGVFILITGWILAWTRFGWFALFQGHTFCMPWIGYILAVNALCMQRSGRSLLTDASARFLLLIPGSILFWWFFEYLNRFVQNWYYVGGEPFGPMAYTLFASLAFATVLPAVLSTRQLLSTFPVFGRGLHITPLPALNHGRMMASGIWIVSGLSLFFLGVYPDVLFPLVWVAPLLLISSLQAIAGRDTLFTPLRRGDWRAIISSAIAALICGFFWELWNVGSLARWQYAIPFVDRFHLFAMPVLGYGGYLPFGLECLQIGDIILGDKNES
jgi:hypothetical protein